MLPVLRGAAFYAAPNEPQRHTRELRIGGIHAHTTQPPPCYVRTKSGRTSLSTNVENTPAMARTRVANDLVAGQKLLQRSRYVFC